MGMLIVFGQRDIHKAVIGLLKGKGNIQCIQ